MRLVENKVLQELYYRQFDVIAADLTPPIVERKVLYMINLKKQLEAKIAAMEDQLLRSKDFNEQLRIHEELMVERTKLQRAKIERAKVERAVWW